MWRGHVQLLLRVLFLFGRILQHGLQPHSVPRQSVCRSPASVCYTQSALGGQGCCAASKKDEQHRNPFIKPLWSTFYLSSTEANIWEHLNLIHFKGDVRHLLG